MWRLINFSLVLLCLLGRISLAESTCSGQNSLDFRDNVSVIPVQFVDYNDGHLTAMFASKTMVERIKFRLPSDLKNSFFEVNGEWEEEIGQRAFLKKIKKDYWMVAYKNQEGENILCEAHQFKNLESLRATYGQSSDNLLKTVDTPAYWRAMKIKPLSFHAIEEEKGYWLFLAETSEPIPDENEYVELENNTIAPTILKTLDDAHLRVVDHGVFTIAKNCIFNILETRNSKKVKLPMTDVGITLSRPKVRVKPIDRAYFVENSRKYFWLCFFDQDTNVLLRAVQMSNDPKEDAANNKNDKESNGKNLK